MARYLDEDLGQWLDEQAEAMDTGAFEPEDILPRLGAGGVFGVGVGVGVGRGEGSGTAEAIEAIAEVSERSLAAGFVFWSQRTFIEYLLQSPNADLRDKLIPRLVAGRDAGATALSNAMKALSGIERLQITARRRDGGFVLDGVMPWVTNLRKAGYHVAAGMAEEGSGRSFVAALPHDAPGLERSPDLRLMGMQSTNTAAIRVRDVPIAPEFILTEDAQSWLPRVRPAFLGLQCGMSIGLARRALGEAQRHSGGGRDVLAGPCEALAGSLERLTQRLYRGVARGEFQGKAAILFELRIALAEVAADAVSLELQAAGGRAYLRDQPLSFSRRWREAAFLPIITPSLVQLKTALAANGHVPVLAGSAA